MQEANRGDRLHKYKLGRTKGKMVNATQIILLALVMVVAALLVRNHSLNQNIKEGIFNHAISKKALQDEAQVITTNYKRAEADLRFAEQKIVEYRSQVQKKNEQLDKSEHSLKEGEQTIERLKSEGDQKTQVIDSMKEDIIKLNADLKDKITAAEETGNQLATAQLTSSQLKTELDQTKSNLKAIEELEAKCRSSLEDKNNTQDQKTKQSQQRQQNVSGPGDGKGSEVKTPAEQQGEKVKRETVSPEVKVEDVKQVVATEKEAQPKSEAGNSNTTESIMNHITEEETTEILMIGTTNDESVYDESEGASSPPPGDEYTA
ncbi:early endosome antigen 1-like [Homarus americanus]|uniref:early endosome antigen 1-like n=1 Tax=Homarus americanus TaxID=6706 RepID=UPI001C46CBFD|nr:early endosome antigen 1-like [Homarus americanus]